jgi:hypothetical protein
MSYPYDHIANEALLAVIDATKWNAKIAVNFNNSPAGVVAAKGDIFPSVGASRRYQPLGPGGDNQIIESDMVESVKMKNSWAFVPVGGIIMWSGLLVSLPANWQICDGTNATPNLRDKFVLGAGGVYAVGATGGAATINIQHNHTSTAANGGAHTHTQANTGNSAHHHGLHLDLPVLENNDALEGGNGVTRYNHLHGVTVTEDETHSHANPVTSSNGAHTHAVTTDNQLSATQNILPTYYALAYIMRLT